MLKIRTIVNPSFITAFQRLQECNMPIQAAYKIRKIMRILQDELDDFHVLNNKLIEKHGNKDENGKIKLSDEQLKNANLELEKLLNTSIIIQTIKLGELGDNVQISPSDLAYLDDLIDVD